MKARLWIIAGSAAVLAAPAADAAKKSPAPGDVSCTCTCVFQTSDGSFETETKHIGGYGEWKGTRSQCQAFNGSQCQGSQGGESGVGTVRKCDTVVHSLPGGGQRLGTPPASTGQTAPAPGGGLPAGTMVPPKKLPRKTE